VNTQATQTRFEGKLTASNRPIISRIELAERSTNVKVAIIEDQRDVREGLAVLINGSPGFRCVGSYRTMEDALLRIGTELPDVVLTDIGLPGMDGVEGIGVLKQRYPDLPVIALTVYDDDERIFDALCAGASGYLLKNTTPARPPA